MKRSDRAQQRIMDEAGIWVQRRLGGDVSPGDQRFLEWLAADPRHADAFERLATTWRKPALWKAVARASGSSARRKPPRHLIIGAGTAVAAVAAAVSVVLFLQAPAPYSAQFATLGGEQRQIELPDGSILTMNGRTSLSVRFDGRTREVDLLAGEVFVAASHDARRPLRVDAGLAEVTVLGTRFNVDRHDAFVDVAVEDGTVLVSTGSMTAKVAAGAAARAERSGTIQRSESAARDAAWRDGWIDAPEIRVGDLVVELSRHSRSELVVDDPALADKFVSGRFSLSEPENTLALIADLVGGRVVENGDSLSLDVLNDTDRDPARHN